MSNINYIIETDPKVSWLENRNGTPSLYSIQIMQFIEGKLVSIEGRKRNRRLRGGIVIDSKAMDDLCIKWLEERGILSVKDFSSGV